MFIIDEKPWDVDTEVEFVHVEDTVEQMELCSHHCRQFEELFQGVMMMDLPKRAADCFVKTAGYYPWSLLEVVSL